MNLSSVATYLQWQKQQIKTAIEEGVKLPKSGKLVHLKAQALGNDYDINEVDLDEFISRFEKEEPGRHPPIAVCRELLIEARHRCAICLGTSTLEYHHVIEFSELKHHDPGHMLVVCATCHGRCGKGEIDTIAQRAYKAKLNTYNSSPEDSDEFPARFSWDELRDVIFAVHDAVHVSKSADISKYDFVSINLDKKNRLNNLGLGYFEHMAQRHGPYLNRVKDFIQSPTNFALAEKYYEIVDELNSKLVADRDKFDRFEDFLILVQDNAKKYLNGKIRTLSIFLTFMYFECDLGRKK